MGTVPHEVDTVPAPIGTDLGTYVVLGLFCTIVLSSQQTMGSMSPRLLYR